VSWITAIYLMVMAFLKEICLTIFSTVPIKVEPWFVTRLENCWNVIAKCFRGSRGNDEVADDGPTARLLGP
jgi:hypothetical protein